MATVQSWTGAETTALRQAMRLSVRAFAARLGVDARTVNKWEARGDSIRLLPDTQDILDTALARAAKDAQERFFQAVAQSKPTRPDKLPAATRVVGELAVVQAVDDLDPISTHSLTSVVDVLGPSQTLDVVARVTRSVIGRYELEGPHRLAPEVRALRRLTHQLSDRVSSAGERSYLARVSAEQAALLAYMSVNLNQFATAEQYALEAAMLATALDDLALLAWIKGTQSFAAYYQHRYSESLNLARVGLHLAGSHAQRIRLLSNGVARAAGKLGDRRTVDHAVGEALELADAQPGPSGMTSCIDFEPYGWARTVANAATAYLSVGDYPKVLDLTCELGTVVAESDSDWSRSLVSLDEATALTLGHQADLEQAATVGLAALAASATKPIASIGSRAAELAASLEGRGPHKAGRDFMAALHEWGKSAEPSS